MGESDSSMQHEARPGKDDAEMIALARREVEAAAAARRCSPVRRMPSRPTTSADSAPGLHQEGPSDSSGPLRSFETPLTDGNVSAARQVEFLPGYEVLRQLHSGGQGIIYLAIQRSTTRKVAIKVMKEGPFATQVEQARFEREIRVLAQLNHPSIVSIHDSGMSAGYQYFVMDYVGGDPLDVWVEDQERPVEDSLRLFWKICEAVNAAHLRGVIHRDLKPGNIRVDETGEPHILDFGLAKVDAGGGELEQSVSGMTMTGQFVGSLPWASPEQAEGAPDKVDIRTDVYSLGVILYQMLTGRLPYDVVGSMRDVLDRIMRVEAAPPSTMNRCIDDEVETIVLKCLAKERERRYQSAGELARDIGHYLAGEPIEAKRDSTTYLLRKTLRKYRLPIALSSSFAVLIVAALLAVSGLYVQAQRALRSEEIQHGHAVKQARLALDRQEEATRQAYVANLAAADGLIRSGDVVAARVRLDACAERLRGWEWNYLNAHTDTSVATLRGHTGRVYSAAFSADGTRLVTASEDKTAKVWDAATREELLTLRGHGNALFFAQFSPDSTHIVTASTDRTARIWDARSGQELLVLCGHASTVGMASFSPDGTRVATASGDQTAKIWNAETGENLTTLRGHDEWLSSASFSPDGARLVTSDGGGTVIVWDVATGHKLMRLLGNSISVNVAVFSPDGRGLITTSDDCTATLWDANTGQKRITLRGHTSGVNTAAFSPNGLWAVTSSYDNTARIWDVQTGQELLTLRGHTNAADGVPGARFSPDGAQVITAGGDNTAKLWDVCADQDVLSLCGHTNLIYHVVFSPDGTRIATSSWDNTVRVWDAWTGRELLRLAGWPGHAVSYSPDSRRLVMSSPTETGDAVATIREAATGQVLVTLRGHADAIRSAAFSPDGTRIVTASKDRTSRLWNAQSGQEIGRLEGHTDAVNRAAFSPDGGRVITASSDGTARLWDVATGVQLRVLAGVSPDPNTAAAFSMDGLRVITSSEDFSAKIWDTLSGAELFTLRGHAGILYDAVFSPDGARVATASRDRTVKIWDAATGRELLTLRGPTYHVICLAFSPDGTRLVTGSWDLRVRVWDSVRWADRLRERAKGSAEGP